MPAEEAIPVVQGEEQLSAYLRDDANVGKPVSTRLSVNTRVIARVTDGIYRLPGSALRELIANAWDADAQNVSIETDAPRFSRITIRDDGLGMSHNTLSHVINSIGGSAKRRHEGQDLGITAVDNAERTPGGRPFIGKIGIGLFSVSQLTRRFTIVTKRKGEDYRLIANVILRQHSEDPEADEGLDDDQYLSGKVEIVRERAVDPDAHGTDIILDAIKPAARDTLRSADRWRALDDLKSARTSGTGDTATAVKLEPPAFHAGWLGSNVPAADDVPTFTETPRLPWDPGDDPSRRMAKLVAGVADQFTRHNRPDLGTALDYYLAMIWQLGLSVPVPYVESHPFDLTAEDKIRLFWLGNREREQATEVPMRPGETVRQAVARWSGGKHRLEDGVGAGGSPMRVVVDQIELKRPISFKYISASVRGLDRSILMVGDYEPDLNRVPRDLRGGRLGFEAYLFWNGRIIPKENNGVLVRIRGASGANFDESFFKYQVSEQTRLRQITSELFVREGLDAALNIDRESFNFAHPHVRLTSSWLHRALRQLTNRHKELSAKALADRKGQDAVESRSRLGEFADQVWREEQGDEAPPDVEIARDRARAQAARNDGIIAFPAAVLPQMSAGTTAEAIQRRAQAEALLKVLAAFGILEDRSIAEQERLVRAIFSVFHQD
ncbi:ATP-binding protein [Roseococcus sp. SDR]|uniref:ATP-binding protein n=1 Tax=Roseococcus sp. SDR TaxID=2835532 RepID=UPI001BD05044|nr:ATP-binding protein [Roseococcus sp. SDR]MBS7790274.1 ATP-binding protein [Roseococcus sp. SDR]MBV1845588.1 ATP-binding protein [Roseococcus sp. SDR]